MTADRKTWTPSDVVDVTGPPALLRNYLEQRDVRAYARQAAERRAIRRAYDIGCGFARLTPVLTEVASEVVGFEREAALVATARRLLPGIRVEHVETLEHLPVADASADLVLTFTVLQHMPDARAEAVLAEIRRVLAPGGHLILAEETDPTLEAGDASSAELGYTRGRPPAWYAERFRPSRLIATSPRLIEPGYPRPDVGTYMFFERLGA
ncbi:MAG TPA: class I SAM-dependent methyltransferase [Vicinamibacterales bacterium]|nr:class I SAM-dependent methyltransferase [Vicinamibacterales bacterium]